MIEDGEVLWPRLRTPPPVNPTDLPDFFVEAEDLELRSGSFREALAGYREAYQQDSSVEIRALALSRIARSEEKLGEHQAALVSWKTLLDNFGSSYDPSHRPYSITARMELGQLDGLYDEIVTGRWDLSAEQFDYYLSRLGRQAPPDNPFEFARELETQFRHTGPLVGMDPVAQPPVARGVWIYAGATLLVVVLLAAGIVLLLRDVRRDLRFPVGAMLGERHKILGIALLTFGGEPLTATII